MKKNFTFLSFLLCSFILFSLPDSKAQEYRNYDGSHNNPLIPHLGSTGSHIQRYWYSPTLKTIILTPAAYEDGISIPRGGLEAPYSLPDPRSISNKVNTQEQITLNEQGLSSMIWLWGQFIDHDIDLFNEIFVPSQQEPFPIPIPEDDPFFNRCGEDADILFSRSKFAKGTGTSILKPREQVNDLTAFIDGSVVYGSEQEVVDSLRSFIDGKLKTSTGNLLPKAVTGPNSFLFAAGDERANEHLALTALHTLFMREHNRLAEYIAQNYEHQLPENAAERDEQIFQMARAVVGAELQIITYREFLPLLLGKGAPSVRQHYNPLIIPNMSGVFSTAAYRFGHSLLPPILYRRNADYQPVPQGDLRLRDAFFQPDKLEATGIEPFLRGVSIQYAQQLDELVVDDLRNFLFESFDNSDRLKSFDLASRNIQRGRDHGIPAYTQVRKYFVKGKPIHSFSDINMDPGIINKLKEAYEHVDQIDLWIGGLCEESGYKGGMLGETFHEIIRDQFTRLRDGDRFWYTAINWQALGFNSQKPLIHSSHKTLHEITLTDIIKWNTDINYIEPWFATDPLIVYARRTDESLAGANDGSIQIFAIGKNQPFCYHWEHGETGSALNNLAPGDYTVSVSDADGNQATYTVKIFPGCEPEDLENPNSAPDTAATANQTNGSSSVYTPITQNYPNPFSELTHITYTLHGKPENSFIQIRNAQGAVIMNINELKTGTHEIILPAQYFTSGVYFYTLISNGKQVELKRMVVQK